MREHKQQVEVRRRTWGGGEAVEEREINFWFCQSRWWGLQRGGGLPGFGGGLASCCHQRSDPFGAWKFVESQIQEPDAGLCSLSIL